MPVCSFPDCTLFCVANSNRCTEHQVKKGEGKLDQKRVSKYLADKQAAATLAATRAARNKAAQTAADAHEAGKLARQQAIATNRSAWSALIDGVVAQVQALRVLDPTANAGNNAVGNTAGGTGNPVALSTTGPMAGLTKGDILRDMPGFDSSDSGLFKFRRQGVLVHCS